MGDLTEVEIFDQMSTSLGAALDCCERLAKRPVGNATYDKFRKHLRLIEGCCKQASAWREDSRWLPIGLMMAQVHKRAGDWLRGYKMPDGTRVAHTKGELHPCFVKLADNLRAIQLVVDRTRSARTGRLGMILPETLAGPHRDTRPVGWTDGITRSRGGIILPQGAAA